MAKELVKIDDCILWTVKRVNPCYLKILGERRNLISLERVAIPSSTLYQGKAVSSRLGMSHMGFSYTRSTPPPFLSGKPSSPLTCWTAIVAILSPFYSHRCKCKNTNFFLNNTIITWLFTVYIFSGFSIILLILFRFLAGIVVWLVLIGVTLACIAGTIYLW